MEKRAANEASYKITYRDDNGKMRYATVRAKSETAAKLKFRKKTGLKAITAEYKLTAAQKRALAEWNAEYYKTHRATYFDGRALLYCDNDAMVGFDKNSQIH